MNHADIQAISYVPWTLNPLMSFLEIPSIHLIVVAEDIATICYKSGTMGTPNGVVWIHGNFMANVARFSHAIKFYPTIVYISYFLLANVRTNQIISAYYGFTIGCCQGKNLTLRDVMDALRPANSCSAPSWYNRIYAGVSNAIQISRALRGRLFRAAYNSKEQAIVSGRNPFPIWDTSFENKSGRDNGRATLSCVHGIQLSAQEDMHLL